MNLKEMFVYNDGIIQTKEYLRTDICNSIIQPCTGKSITNSLQIALQIELQIALQIVRYSSQFCM